jgi:hypothetical protein
VGDEPRGIAVDVFEIAKIGTNAAASKVTHVAHLQTERRMSSLYHVRRRKKGEMGRAAR